MNYEAHGTFNIGAGKNYSINEVAALVAPGHPTVNLPPRLGEASLTLDNYSRAKVFLGWQPHIDLQTGLSIIDKFENRSKLILP